MKFIINTDGGSRGNPGPAAVGVVIDGPEGKKFYSEYIGETTNNDAEYKAVILALKKLKELAGDKAKESSALFLLDSELVVKQLAGEYKVKDPNIINMFREIWDLRLNFSQVEFRHIPREENSEADELVNEALDKKDH